jgi:protein-tyrosine-phosphatase
MERHLLRMTEESSHMLHQAVQAFNDDNVELARATMVLDTQADHLFQDAYEDLSDEKNKESWPIRDLFGLLSVFYSLERVSDLSKNICEKTVFSILGEGKKRKPVSVLFLEESCNYLAPMAKAIGKKSFPETGIFNCAGKISTAPHDPGLQDFMTAHGLDFKQEKQTTIEMLPRLDEFTVIISLQGKVDSYISAIPFNVIVLEWEAGPPIADIPEEEKADRFKDAYHLLSDKLHTLLETMRGKEGAGGTA